MDVKYVCQLDDDGFFAGLVQADESPLEPGVFLLPGGSVDIPAPQIQPEQCAKLIDGVWHIQPDHRGLTYWTEDGRRHVITQRGIQPPAGFLQNPPGPTPEQLSSELTAEARALLEISDLTILRCYEAHMPVPQSWKDYRTALRLIASTGSGVIPTRPEYPPGT